LRATQGKAVNLRENGSLDLGDLDYIVEALALHLFASFESFVNDIFLLILSEGSEMTVVRSRLRTNDPAVAREILYGDSEVLEWSPVAVVVRRANRFLEYGQPFSRLRFRNLEPVDNLRVIRNRIAHHGEKARATYEAKIMRGDQGFARPARWLTHVKAGRTSDNLTLLIDAISAVAEVISTDDPDLDSLLGPPFQIDAGASVPACVLSCRACRSTESISSESKAPGCSTCEQAGVDTPAKWDLVDLNYST
jgi:hypothetical protein